ncbi:MAG: hypothetical protein IJZ87_09960 [Bacteroidales bacterium]|nr:hypothetical protein [Bacteroidales bacterium]
MKKLLLSAAVLLTLGFISCSPSPVGTWVEPAGNTEEQGFTLYQDGLASSINMGYIEFKNWEKSGDLLILKGNYLGSNKREFSDTMKIESITKTEMTLSQAGYSVTYIKK